MIIPLASFVSALPVQAEPQRYRLELYITWSQNTHPYDWPTEGGSLSPLVGATHHAGYSMFADGNTSSPALKQLAETGKLDSFKIELKSARSSDGVGNDFISKGLKHTPGIISAEFTATLEHQLLSFATMIAPSPDWFTGAASVNLRAKGEWLDSVDFPIWAWDAGTDNGPTYNWPNLPTVPPQSVRLLSSPHVIYRDGLRPIGRAVITRIF